ncbi:MAG: transposase [Muribaculaceae bacterium]|nr:transposase [Muribaculaceae bacterium]
MDRDTFKKQKAYAGERKPSMHRRCLDHNYQERCVYLITLVTESRRPLFGKLTGKSDAARGSADEPRIILSQLGKEVQHNFYSIEERHPEIHVISLQMMPDHLHGILFVRESIDKHLGQVIAGFKAGCNKSYRHIVLGEKVPCAVSTPQQAHRPRPPRSSYNREQGLLFASGYNDKILLHTGQLDRWINYLSDNPRRLLAKQEHPDLFRVQFGLSIAGQSYAAIGNRFLLNRPMKRQVQCSRRLNEQEIIKATEQYLEEARRGIVLVSPSISPGEKAIMRAALDAQLPLIFLSPTSFTPFTKPSGEFIEACSRGNLLILSPWSNRSTTQTLTRQECLALNNMTRAICEMG